MNPTRPVLDGKTFAIGVLSITACVLLVGFLLLATTPKPAYGIGLNDRGGDYIMLTQQLSSSQEGLVVVDAATKRLILYAFDFNKKQLEIIQGLPLDRLSGEQQQPRGPARP